MEDQVKQTVQHAQAEEETTRKESLQVLEEQLEQRTTKLEMAQQEDTKHLHNKVEDETLTLKNEVEHHVTKEIQKVNATWQKETEILTKNTKNLGEDVQTRFEHLEKENNNAHSSISAQMAAQFEDLKRLMMSNTAAGTKRKPPEVLDEEEEKPKEARRTN